MQNIKMVDLHGQYLHIKSEIDQAIQQVLDESMFINGPSVKKFAGSLATYLNVEHIIPCGNGTDALQIALMSLDLKKGDEVIIPSHTYVATAEVAALLGLKIVFIDVDEYDFTIDVKELEKVITSKTKVIVPVHLYGQCANMEVIMKIAQENDLFVIEDTAQALGADYLPTNLKAGTIGHIGTTSFFPSKTLGAYGDGGALMTNDDALAEKCKMIANHGQPKKYQHDIIGCNSRLDTLQAAILDVKLKYLNQYNKQRQEVASFYDEVFSTCSFFQVPKRRKDSTHVFHQYTLKCREKRDVLKKKLHDAGIPTMIYYPIPLHLQKAYEYLGYKKGDILVTEKLSETIISLPVHTELSKDEQSYISETVLKIVKGI